MERIFKKETRVKITAVFHQEDMPFLHRKLTVIPQVCNHISTERGYFLDRVETKEGLVYCMVKLSKRLRLYSLCSCGAYPFRHRTGSGQCEGEEGEEG